MIRRILRKTALVLLWLVFVFALLELTGYVYFKLEISKPAGGYGYPKAMFIAQDKVEYALRPGFEGHFDGVAFFKVPISINASGFRDRPFGPKQPGVTRVAVLGDSVVFGAGVAAEERFTDLLRGKVTLGGKPAALMNLGVNSYAFVHYLGQVQRNFEGLAPDAVVIGITLNDYQGFQSAWPRKLVREDDPTQPDALLEHRIRRYLATTLAGRFLTDLRDKAMLALLQDDESEAYHTKWMRKTNEQWQRRKVRDGMLEKLRQMQALLAERHLPVLYLIFPERNDLEDPGTYGYARTAVVQLLQEVKAPVCDPYPAFAAVPEKAPLFLTNDSVHFTATGHRLLADALAQCMAAPGWLSPKAPPK